MKENHGEVCTHELYPFYTSWVGIGHRMKSDLTLISNFNHKSISLCIGRLRNIYNIVKKPC